MSENKDEIIAQLQAQVLALRDDQAQYFASSHAALSRNAHGSIPQSGMPARHVKECIVQQNQLDNKPRLNTSSYVNVITEPEEEDIILLGMATNLADASVYPASVRIHNDCVNMIAKLWNAPEVKGDYSGAGTVGSTEACLLAGLALKFRWRSWYAKKYGLTSSQVLSVLPNLVISTCFQAAWEKFFRYFDVEPRFCKPSLEDKFKVNAESMAVLCDEKTIAVVGILGNHYNGAYDPIWDIDEAIGRLNTEKGYQIGIHIDAASGGFIAPFQDSMPPFDFRLKNVMSISASGHKFGESVCGTGWVVFRHREDLAEHIAVTVSYLGGQCDSMTLNFSRPATAAYAQYYQFLRLGMDGYKKKVDNQMAVSKFLRDRLKAMKFADGRPRFHIVDDGDTHCLPVVGARLSPEGGVSYDDVDLQHALSESHWYVSGYQMNFDNFTKAGELEALLIGAPIDASMFRVVVKSNLTMTLAEDLADHIDSVIPLMDSMKDGYHSIHSLTTKRSGGELWLLAQKGVIRDANVRYFLSHPHAAC